MPPLNIKNRALSTKLENYRRKIMNPIINIIQKTINFIDQNMLVKEITTFLFVILASYAVILFFACKAENKKGLLTAANLVSMVYGIFILLFALIVIVIPIIDENQSFNDAELSNAIIVFILGSLKVFFDTIKNTIELNQL